MSILREHHMSCPDGGNHLKENVAEILSSQGGRARARGFKGGYQRVVRKSSRSKTRYQYRPQSVRMRCCRIECKQILSTTSSVSTLAMMVVIHGHFRLKFFHDVRLTQPSEIADDVKNSMFHLVLRRGRGKKSLSKIVPIAENEALTVNFSMEIVTEGLSGLRRTAIRARS